MYISLVNHIAFDAATEAAAASEFEKRHPNWTKTITNTKTISFHYHQMQTFELVSGDKSPADDIELLMPGIYIKEVK